MRQTLWSISLLLVSLLAPAQADDLGDSGTKSPFSFGAGARELALGAADLTSASASYSAYWSPSALVDVEHFSFSGFHAKLFESDVKYQYLGFAAPTLDYGVFGVSVFRLGIDNIERRDINNSLIGTISDERLAIYLGFATEISGYDFGFSVFSERHDLDTYRATTSPGLNLSLRKVFRIESGIFNSISVALIGRNVVQPSAKLSLATIEYPYSVDAAASIAMRISEQEVHTLAIYGRLNKVDQISTKGSVGIEYGFHNLISARAGINQSNPAVGLGLEFHNFGFDYAVVGRDLGSLHTLNLSTFFGTSVSTRKNNRISRQESEFETLMTNRVQSRNKLLIAQLISEGKELQSEDKHAFALEQLNKALFIARSSQSDTSEISLLAERSAEQVEARNNIAKFEANLDSARVRFESHDYLFAKYFAQVALEFNSESSSANDIYTAALDSLTYSRQAEELLASRISEVDSLLTRGRLDDALLLTAGLNELAPDDNQVKRVSDRAQFERLRNRAQLLTNSSRPEAALTALDSALALFPEHEWCLHYRESIVTTIESHKQVEVSTIAKDYEPISAESMVRAEQHYQAGRTFFSGGKLGEAISEWEEVILIDQRFKSVREYLIKAYKLVGVENYVAGELSAAIATWGKGLRLDGSDKELRNYISRAESENETLRKLSYGR